MAIATAGVPIIGRTRSWTNIRFLCQPIAEKPADVIPGELAPSVVGWLIGFEGLRSDEFPVRALNMVPLAHLTDVPAVLKVIGIITQQFESFRECDCRPNIPCRIHGKTNAAAS